MLSSLTELEGFTTTINTTEQCNLRCAYCYEINKKNKTIPIEYAKMYIDRLLEDDDPADLDNDPDPTFRNLYDRGWIVDFIGGDSFMNPDILDELMGYVIFKLRTTNTKNSKRWRNKLTFSISTNGTLFNSKVKALCEKYKNVLAPGISIDGCPEIHDKYRVFPDGRGSMSAIMENWDWFRKTFPFQSIQTKSTCSKATIPYLFESLKFMYEDLGIIYINQNFIMEDGGINDDDIMELERQLKRCIEYVLLHRHELFWSMIAKEDFADAHMSTGDDWEQNGHCGSGAMPALSVDGKIYPCFRWLPHTQNVDKTDFIVGDIWKGFYNKKAFSKVRKGAYRSNCSKSEKCRDCDCESACAYCIGGCYSEFGEFKRTTYICKVTKAQVKWARVYWNEFNKLEGLPMEYPEEYQLDKIKFWSKEDLLNL